MDTKKCSKCGVEKNVVCFNKDKTIKSGLRCVCKDCSKQYYLDNKERRSEQTKQYRSNNKERAKQYYLDNKERRNKQARQYSKQYYENNKERAKQYYLSNKEQIKERVRRWKMDNKKRINEQARQYRSNNKKYVNELEKRYRLGDKYKERRKQYLNLRRTIDPVFKLRERISKSVRKALKLQGSAKNSATWSKLPYTPQQLREHLESQFDSNMSWENHGTYWHIDHIHPQSLLPFDSMDHPNFQKCWALENLRPLEAIENIRKGNKVM